MMLNAKNNVQNYCLPLFDRYRINFFNFARMYDDGTCQVFSSNLNLIEYFFQQEYPLFIPVPKSVLKNKFYYFIEENHPCYSSITHEVRNLFNTANGFDIFQVHNGYVDVACFGANPNNNDILNFYFNNTNILDNFVKDFRKEFVVSNHSRIALPRSMQLNFTSEDLLKTSNQSNILSNRELECLHYLVLGKSAREISIILDLSKRTVEHYLENIKIKFAVEKKSELIAKAIVHFDLQKNIIQ